MELVRITFILKFVIMSFRLASRNLAYLPERGRGGLSHASLYSGLIVDSLTCEGTQTLADDLPNKYRRINSGVTWPLYFFLLPFLSYQSVHRATVPIHDCAASPRPRASGQLRSNNVDVFFSLFFLKGPCVDDDCGVTDSYCCCVWRVFPKALCNTVGSL